MSYKLYDAIETNNLELTKSVTSEGADVNQTDKDGSTPLHAALRVYSIEIMELLLKNNANLDQIIKGKYTLLYVSCFQGQTDIVKLLLTKGANVSLTGENKLTPLYAACENNHITIATLLIEAMLLKNPIEEKPDYIKTRQDLSAYWDEHKVKLELEIASLKQVTFGRISLFDFYTLGDIKKLATMSRNEDIQNIITKTDFIVKYPYFGNKIKENFEKGLARAGIIEQIIKNLYPIEQQLSWLGKVINWVTSSFIKKKEETKNIRLVGVEDVDRIIMDYLNINNLKSLEEATNNPPINNSSGISFFQQFRTHNDSLENTSISSYSQRP